MEFDNDAMGVVKEVFDKFGGYIQDCPENDEIASQEMLSPRKGHGQDDEEEEEEEEEEDDEEGGNEDNERRFPFGAKGDKETKQREVPLEQVEMLNAVEL